MLAAVYRGPGSVSVEEIPVPDIGPGEALIQVRACGICGTDLKKIALGLVPPPRVFGHEMAGVVAAVGPDVTRWRTGDRVLAVHHVPCEECHYCRRGSFAQCPTYLRTGTTAGFEPAGGGFAQFVRAMPLVVERGMDAVPEDVSFEEATFVEPVNTCLKAVVKAGVRGGDTVVVLGQGQIGLILLQIAREAGASVITSDPIAFRRAMSERMGATAALDPTRHDVASEARVRSDGRGADVALIATPSGEAVSDAVSAVRAGGRVVLFAHTHLNDPVTIDAGEVCVHEKDIIGSYSSDISLQPRALELVFQRRIDVRSLVTHRFPLDRISEGIAVASSPRDNSLKVMVNP